MATRRDEFFAAVRAGDAERVRDLLASDPDLVHATDDEGATGLHHAAERAHRDVVRLLLERGAAINARDGSFAATPTGWAIEYLRGLGGLLAVEIEDMLFAIRERDVRWARRLLARRPALARARDASGKPLSEHGAECGNDDIARLFRRDAEPGKPGGDPRA